MNYAVDRLDRKVRCRDGIQGLFLDYQEALQSNNHSRLAHTFHVAGLLSRAVYHAGVAWSHDEENPLLVGDYAQLCEMNGYPEIGMIALLCFRTRGRMKEAVNYVRSERKCFLTAEEWAGSMVEGGRCGCGSEWCGELPCFMPMEKDAIQSVLNLLRLYLIESKPSKTMTAHNILLKRAKNEPIDLSSSDKINIPLELQFWLPRTNDDETSRALSPLLQTLLTKLLFLTVPALACDAVIHSTILQDNSIKSLMVREYKSHMAYFVLMDAVVLGRGNIKPGRRHMVQYYNVPIHDQFHQLDGRIDYAYCRDKKTIKAYFRGASSDMEELANDFFHRLQQVIGFVNGSHNAPPSLVYILPSLQSLQPLFLVGDSHVLSLGWQVVQQPSMEFRRVTPVVVTGLKAWHVRRETKFFTRTNLTTLLNQRLQSAKTILFSAGEIDCREGLGGQMLAGYQADKSIVKEHVERTVQEYVTALTELVDDGSNGVRQILVLPVAPHAAKATSRAVGQASRRETTRLWNETLQCHLPSKNVYLLDYTNSLLDEMEASYTLLPELNADSTHMNAAFARLLEQSLATCGCNLDLL